MNTTTPIVVSTSPAWDVATNRYMYATFSRDMDASTITPETFQVAGVTGSVTYDAQNRIAYFTPSGMLTPGAAYVLTLTTGIKATNGQPMPIPYSFKFHTRSTIDLSAPTASLANVGCVSTSGSVDIYFDELMDSSTINTSTIIVNGVTGSVSYNPANHTASFTPTTPFTANTTYTGTVTTGAKDLGEVPLAKDFNFSFTTCPAVTGNSFCSYTKGGYAGPGKPGQLFTANFSNVFFDDLIIGVYDGAGPQTSARFTAASPGPTTLQGYLTSPAGGPSAAFPADEVNPNHTVNGQLPEQTAALALNVGFSGVGGSPAGFGNLVLTGTGTSLDGSSVNDILGFANYALAGNGLPQGFTFSSLNDLVDNLNQSWDNCTQDGWAQSHLTQPQSQTE
jgi:hypothetical protein